MASKRMFSRDVIGSDAFADLGFEAQALYVHLCMDADDYGFVGSPRRVTRAIGSRSEVVDELDGAGFIHVFDTGVLVIMDWFVNNYIPEKRRKATQHGEEFALLTVQETGRYVVVDKPHTDCMQTACNVQTVSTQDACESHASTEENRGEEKSTEEKRREKKGRKKFVKPTVQEIEDFILSEKLYRMRGKAQYFYDYYESNGWMVGRNHMQDWKATLRNWNRRRSNDTEESAHGDAVFDAIGYGAR